MEKNDVLSLAKKLLGNVSGDFFTNSSGHPVLNRLGGKG
jgi:hypothetical protein